MSQAQLQTLVEQYTPDLSRLCLHLCRNQTDAEDLFQDTWCRAIRFYDTYDDARPFDKWLFAICVNSFKNQAGSARCRKERLFATNAEKDAFFASIPEVESPCKAVEYQELYRIVDALSPKLKIVILLRYFRDYTEADVAQILQVPLGTVKSRLHKAKRRIKEVYDHGTFQTKPVG